MFIAKCSLASDTATLALETTTLALETTTLASATATWRQKPQLGVRNRDLASETATWHRKPRLSVETTTLAIGNTTMAVEIPYLPPEVYGRYNPRHVTMKFKPDGNLSPTHYGLNVYQIDAWDLLVNCHSHSLMRPLAERHAV